MRALVLDSNAYSALMTGSDKALEVLQVAEIIAVPTVVLGELLGGFAWGSREAENRQQLSRFLDSDRVRIETIDEETASWYGRIYARLRAKGRPIPTNDLWISALAMQHGLPVLSYDEHFDQVDGLTRITQAVDLQP